MSEVKSETVARKSLIEKYDIPIDHLDFEYIKSCSNIKEIERIVKILRSPEEGHYPDLLKEAEGKLKELDPKNRLLWVQGKPLTRDTLDPSYWKDLVDDIQNWTDEVSQKEKALLAEKKGVVPDKLPPVRKKPVAPSTSSNTVVKKEERIKAYEYDKWDKYDPEVECLKMDLAEEKRRESNEQSTGDTSQETVTLPPEDVKGLTVVESEKLAGQEKDLGNEFYKTGDVKEAISHYCKSLSICPSATAYNNRAAAYLKCKKYDEAVSDASNVISLEPDNIKAYYRRAQAFQNLNKFKQALSDVEAILKIESNHSAALQLKYTLKKQCSAVAPLAQKRIDLAKKAKLMAEPAPGPSGLSYRSSHKISEMGSERRDRGKMRSIEVVEVVSEEGACRGGARPAEPVTSRLESSVPQAEDKRSPPAETKARAGSHAGGTSRGERPAGQSEQGTRQRHRPHAHPPSPSSRARPVWDQPPEELEVASKYKEKASREGGARGGVRSPMTLPHSASVRPTPPASPLDTVSFITTWQALTRESAPLSHKASLLRRVKPHLLQAVIGSKLDEAILGDLIVCLKEEFKVNSEQALIVEYLTAIANLERFSIISSFLPSFIKTAVGDLLTDLSADESLKKLFS